MAPSSLLRPRRCGGAGGPPRAIDNRAPLSRSDPASRSDLAVFIRAPGRLSAGFWGRVPLTRFGHHRDEEPPFSPPTKLPRNSQTPKKSPSHKKMTAAQGREMMHFRRWGAPQ